MGRPKARPGEPATLDRILRAALREFGNRGLDAARLADIAREADITRPSLLYHFPTKADLYAQVVRDAFRRLGAVLMSAIESEQEFGARFEATVRSFAKFVESEPELSRLVVREVIDGRGPGRDLVLEEGLPVIGQVELFLRNDNDGRIPSDLPLRPALLQIAANAMVRSASGSLKEPLWGEPDCTLQLARHLFFGGPR